MAVFRSLKLKLLKRHTKKFRTSGAYIFFLVVSVVEKTCEKNFDTCSFCLFFSKSAVAGISIIVVNTNLQTSTGLIVLKFFSSSDEAALVSEGLNSIPIFVLENTDMTIADCVHDHLN